MGSSCSIMVLQREMWTRKFRHWSTTIGSFMNASIIPLHMVLLAHICIYLSSPLMIDPTRIKEPDIPHICSQLPFLLPLKTLLVLLPPLLIRHISFLLIILILSMSRRQMCLSKVGSTVDNYAENMVK